MDDVKYSTDRTAESLLKLCREATDGNWHNGCSKSSIVRGKQAKIFVYGNAKLTIGDMSEIILMDGSLFILGDFTLLPRTSIQLIRGMLALGDGYLGQGSFVSCQEKLWIADADIAPMCYIADAEGHGITNSDGSESVRRAPTIIHEHVFIGPGSTVLANSEIGAGSVIGPKSFVRNMEIPPCCYAEGVPAKPIERGITWTRRKMDLDPML